MVCVFLHCPLSHSQLVIDDFYVFDKTTRSNQAARRIKKSELTSEANYVKDIFTSNSATPLVDLLSTKSGLKVTFDSNRASVFHLSISPPTCNRLLMWISFKKMVLCFIRMDYPKSRMVLGRRYMVVVGRKGMGIRLEVSIA